MGYKLETAGRAGDSASPADARSAPHLCSANDFVLKQLAGKGESIYISGSPSILQLALAQEIPVEAMAGGAAVLWVRAMQHWQSAAMNSLSLCRLF